MSPVDADRDSKDVVVSLEDANATRVGTPSRGDDNVSDVEGADSSNLQNSHEDATNDQDEADEEPCIELKFLPPDQRSGHHGDLLLAAVVEPEIEEDTEAAEALRANAKIKVGKVSKAARGINAQTVRKLVKVASLRGRGIKRGKPPRVPPGLAGQHHQQTDHLVRDGEENQIYAVQEEDDESDVGEESDGASNASSFVHDPTVASTTNESEKSLASKNGQDTENVQDEQVSKESKLHPQQMNQHISLDAIAASSKPPKWHNRLDPYATTLEENDADIPKDVVAETMDVERKLMGALDPHNMLMVQRWRKKKKAGKKKRKSYVKGKVIDGKHELYTLSIAVMLGVRTSIARTNTIISSSDGGRNKILSPQDFMAEDKYEFAPKGSPTTPPHKLSHTFKFKDYAPVAFAYVRRLFGVNEFDFLLSVCGNANFIEFISNAKSGQFFFYSSDGKYMIKTMTNSESKFLRRILPHYFRHCTENPNTLLTKFYGMYRVKLYHLRRNVKFVIMNSVYYTDKSIQTFYDLKGSEMGRTAKPGQDVLKDNDLRKNIKEQAFSFKPELRMRFRAQVESDCNFLRKMQIMDYSMLIGVHHIPPRKLDQRGNIADTGFKIQEHRSHRKSNSRGLTDKDMKDILDSSNRSNRSLGSHDNPKDTSNQENADLNMENHSTKHLIKDIRETAYSQSNFEFAELLEDDDDCSYLEGSDHYNEQYAEKLRAYQQHPKYKDVEKKKEQTIEQIYWPFHRFFDINGHRRMDPKKSSSDQQTSDLIKAWKIPEFVAPLSDRKDGGHMMDASDFVMPMVFNGKQGKMAFEGKIYYMGIIDILQQYNVRKRAETRYRKMEVRGKTEPSCVCPDEYAERFIYFFDQYSQKAHPKTYGEEESTEIEITRNETAKISVTSNNKIVPLLIEDSNATSNGSSGSSIGNPN